MSRSKVRAGQNWEQYSLLTRIIWSKVSIALNFDQLSLLTRTYIQYMIIYVLGYAKYSSIIQCQQQNLHKNVISKSPLQFLYMLYIYDETKYCKYLKRFWEEAFLHWLFEVKEKPSDRNLKCKIWQSRWKLNWN